MKAAFIDCSIAGVSGDMLTAALIDAGAPAGKVKKAMLEAGRLFGELEVAIKHTRVSGIRATRVEVRTSDVGGRSYPAIVKELENLRLPPQVRRGVMDALTALARAEATVHGKELNSLVLHEVGAADAVADIVGCFTAAYELGLLDREVLASEVAVGKGLTAVGHGEIPLPAPAVLEILRGVPISGKPIEAELTTPTGASLLVALVDRFVPAYPAMTIEAIGYGAGARKLEGLPNVVRICLGELSGRALELEEVNQLETNVDDVSGEVIGYVIERLMAEGALDVSATPMLMKKGRPGHLIRVICRREDSGRLAELLMLHTGTLGVRVLPVSCRYVLPRRMLPLEVTLGGRRFKVKVKVSEGPGGARLVAAEYEDARRIAELTGLPLREVMGRVEAAARHKLK
jgi:uncharacterized protein (TIGR00299 family) protein